MEDNLSEALNFVENKSLESLESIYLTTSKSFIRELSLLELGYLCGNEIISIFDERKKKQLLYDIQDVLIIRQRNQMKYINNNDNDENFIKPKFTFENLSYLYISSESLINATIIYFNSLSIKDDSTLY